MRTLILKENKEEWAIDFADIEYKKIEFQNILKNHDFISYIGKVGGSKFLNITPAPLRKDLGEDHGFIGILKDEQGKYPFASETGKNTGELMQYLLRSMIDKSMRQKEAVTNNEFLEVLQEFLKIYVNEKAKQRLIRQLADKVKKEIFIELLKEFLKEEIVKILLEESKNNTKDKKDNGWTK